ncbi:MAG: hypothetical protein ACWA44_09370 [Thiotrichales bacterium]
MSEQMTILDAYKNTAQQHNLPKMQSGSYDSQLTIVEDRETLFSSINFQRPQSGWLQFQSHQCYFIEELVEPEETWGTLMSGEIVHHDTNIARINLIDGKWHMNILNHCAEGEMLWDEVEQLLPGTGTITYRRYWQQDPEQGYLQVQTMLKAIRK